MKTKQLKFIKIVCLKKQHSCAELQLFNSNCQVTQICGERTESWKKFLLFVPDLFCLKGISEMFYSGLNATVMFFKQASDFIGES